jgi:hypothetical protein
MPYFIACQRVVGVGGFHCLRNRNQSDGLLCLFDLFDYNWNGLGIRMQDIFYKEIISSEVEKFGLRK